MVDGGGATDSEFLTSAARLANKRWDGALADRLAASAIAAGGGPCALLVRGDACFKLGRYEESLRHLSAVDDAELDDEELAHLAMLLAETGFWGLGRATETHAALRRLAQRVKSDRARQRVHALRSAIMYATDDRLGASEIALPIASDPKADGLARLRASTAAAGWLSFSGHPQAALELCEALLPVGFEHANESQRGVGWVDRGDAGRLQLPRAVRRSGANRRRGARRGDRRWRRRSCRQFDARAREVGADPRRPRDRACSMGRQATAALHAYDAAGYLPWCLGLVAQIAAQLGDATAASDAIVELDGIEWIVRLNDYEVATGRAWAAVAAGELQTPVRVLLDTATDAGSKGNRFTQGFVLHEALRIGAPPRDVIDGLEEACTTGELPVHEIFLARRTSARRRRRCGARGGIGVVRAVRVPVVGGGGGRGGGRRVPTRRPDDARGTLVWRGEPPGRRMSGRGQPPRSRTCSPYRPSPVASSR